MHKVVGDTALHPRKDLAVSPLRLPAAFTHEGCPFLSVETSLLAPRALRRTGVTCYVAPPWDNTSRITGSFWCKLSCKAFRTFKRSYPTGGECPDFPPHAKKAWSDRLTRAKTDYTTYFIDFNRLRVGRAVLVREGVSYTEQHYQGISTRSLFNYASSEISIARLT